MANGWAKVAGGCRCACPLTALSVSTGRVTFDEIFAVSCGTDDDPAFDKIVGALDMDVDSLVDFYQGVDVGACGFPLDRWEEPTEAQILGHEIGLKIRSGTLMDDRKVESTGSLFPEEEV